MNDAPALQVEGLSKSFGAMASLRDINLTIENREIVALIGPSGCGKSTLLRCINYLERPDSGTVRIKGDYIGRERLADGKIRNQPSRKLNLMRPRVGLVFQQFNLWPHMTVLENIARAPIRLRKTPKENAEQDALSLLERFSLAGKANRKPGDLSGGEKQRVAIARALAMKPALMLFDEPTSALDPEIVGDVLKLMKDMAQDGMTMLVVTHELAFARAVADSLVFMDKGSIVEMGAPSTLIDTPKSKRLQEFLSHFL